MQQLQNHLVPESNAWVSTSTQTPTWNLSLHVLHYIILLPACSGIRVEQYTDKIDESFTLVALLLLCVTGKAERYCASNAFASVTIQNRTLWAAQHSKMAFLTSLGVNLTARNAMSLNSLGFRPVVSQATPFTVCATMFPCYIHLVSPSLTDINQMLATIGGCLAVMAQWQSTGGSSQRCPGFDSRQLLAFSLYSIFTS